MCVYKYVCMYVHTHTHTQARARAREHPHPPTLTHTHTHTHTRSILIFTRMELNQPHYSPCPIHYSVAIRHLALPPSKPTPSCQVPIYTLLSLLGHSYADRFLSDQHPPTPPLPSATRRPPDTRTSLGKIYPLFKVSYSLEVKEQLLKRKRAEADSPIVRFTS